jgi:hypothetical protein
MRLRVALIALVAVAGCGSDPDPPPPDRDATVDERAGTYRGVGIGSSAAEARRELGRLETGATDPLAPIGTDGSDLGFPPAPRNPPSGGIAVWRFEDVAMAADRDRAWLVTVAADDAWTQAGVGVGSALEDVREAYPDADCDTAYEGSEGPQFDYCTVRVARDRYLWFAYDPVRSLTMSREALR